jgi:hypothetical protein
MTPGGRSGASHSGQAKHEPASILPAVVMDKTQGLWIPGSRFARPGMTTPVMPALVAGIHVFLFVGLQQDADGRDKPGHDAEPDTLD